MRLRRRGGSPRSWLAGPVGSMSANRGWAYSASIAMSWTTAGTAQCTVGRRLWAAAVAVAVWVIVVPAGAQAHGPVAPIATSYSARVTQLPPGVEAKVIDGDQRMWLRVAPTESVVVLDYRGVAYLRFTSAGVDVNQNSAMYYFNLNPAEVPPANLGPRTPPRWSRASGGHEFSWHDGRLHALATVAIAPGTAYVGRWSIPVRVNGSASAIAGGLWHADDPSLVWFWPIVVLIACMLAARRVNRPEIDVQLARWYSVAALAGITITALGRELHGRPSVSVFQMISLAIFAVFVAWGSRRLVLRRATYFTYFVIAFVAIWQGINSIPTLLHGFVLAATPAFVTRAACVLCLGCGISLLVIPLRMVGEAEPDEPEMDEIEEEDALFSESRT
jgi:hypothetical protein